jgi:hypothetical protein
MTVSVFAPTPAPAPSIVQYELYSQNGPLALGAGIYITQDGRIAVDAANIPGVIYCGVF